MKDNKAYKAVVKVNKAVNEGGIILLFNRTIRFSMQRFIRLYSRLFYRPPVHKVICDVLIINGCTLKHPSRYRVDHKLEQLRYFGMSGDQIFREHLEERHLHIYRSFVFFRCPSNEFIDDFIKKAKQANKVCFFDIDDLIFDKDYVSEIEYVKSLSEKSHNIYMLDVEQMGKTFEQCDFGITTTVELQNAMLERQDDVFINRNVASSEMIDLSEKAYNSQLLKSQKDNCIRIGYLSGSITHNPDLVLIEDALLEVASKYPQVEIVLVGLVNPTKKLARLGKQLVLEEFCKWEKLPEVLASLDINLAPLEDTRFNRSKSENKWLEAALVRVPTLASSVGSFNEAISNNDTGFLCSTKEEWVKTISSLIENPELINKIGQQAYQHVKKAYVTQKTGLSLVDFIASKLNPFVVFVIPTLMLSGGMRVILQHAKAIKESGADVLLYVDSDDEIQTLEFEGQYFSVVGTREVSLNANIDILSATLWTTVNRVISQQKAKRKIYLVQNYETDFYQSDQLHQKQAASSTYLHPENIEYLTISKWCQSWLKDIYRVDSNYIPNGINYNNFSNEKRIQSFEGVINILIEGNCDDPYKNVDESMKIIDVLKDRYGKRIQCHYLAYRATPKGSYQVDELHFQVPFEQVAQIYKNCHVLIKSSKVESFSYPPIEMMATGGLVILGENEGNVEYAVHNENCLMYTIGDISSAASYFDMLLENPELRDRLANNGVKTAQSRDWGAIEELIKDFWLKNENLKDNKVINIVN